MKHFPLVCSLLLLPLAASHAASSPSVPRDGKFEASWTLPAPSGNPFDPADNDVDVTFAGPDKTRAVVPAFWDGDRWRVRFAPTRTGPYTLFVTRNGRRARPLGLSASAFRCVPSADSGFLRRSPRHVQQFVLDNGQTYYPLGMNVAWAGGTGPDYPVYFANMGQAHMNWARVWMNNWDGKNLEWAADKAQNPKIGTYFLPAARRWDTLMDAATKNGVSVQMVLQHHGQYTNLTDPNWKDNPFNAANGGFLQKPDDFFTDPEARRLTRAKYRYIVARWGYSTHLLSYELFNEVQNIGEARTHFQDVVNWHREMAAFIRSVDTNHHLVTTSNSPQGDPLSRIGLDYVQVHTYPPDILSTFAGVRTAGVAVPLFYGEWGPTGARPEDAERLLHDGLWASLMAPTAGAGQYWSWDVVSGRDLWPVFASAAGFVRAFPAARPGLMTPLAAVADTGERRGDLSFAPSGDWGPTTKTDVTLPADGGVPDLSGVSSFIQGGNNRTLMPRPITFRLNAAQGCRFSVQVGTVAASGAHPTLSLDGGPPQEQDFPAQASSHDANQTLSVDVPAGAHAVSLFNTGPDWFVAKQITAAGYVPAVGILAKGDARAAEFWAYSRGRTDTAPQDAAVRFPALAAGTYRVRLWNTQKGVTYSDFSVTAQPGAGAIVPLHGIIGDTAGVITRAQPTPAGQRNPTHWRKSR